jgi:uncharacterized protein YjbI with pentapeptide repeats
MNAFTKPISKTELQAVLRNRITLDYPAYEKRIDAKEVNDEVVLEQRILLNNNTYITPLTFNNCIFNEMVNVGLYENAGRITFQDCVFNKGISVDLDNSFFEGNCVFNDDLVIRLRRGDVDISNYNIQRTLKITGTAKKLTVKNINAGQEIKDQTIIISVSVWKLEIQSVFGTLLEFSGNRVEGQLLIHNIEFSKVHAKSLVLDTEMKINKSKIGEFKIGNIEGDVRGLYIDDSSVQDVKYPIYTFYDAVIMNCSINNIILYGLNKNDNILNIEKTTITNLIFESVINNGLITLRELNIPPLGMVSFKSSNLGKADFIYCNFSKATLEFENSKITEAFFSETEFPKRVLVNGRKNYGQAQLAFGQLATAFQRQGDNIRAFEYMSRELEAHYRNINWLSFDFFHKLNLWLNLISNNFGRDWVRGVAFSLGVGLLFFCLLLISTDKYTWGLPGIQLELLPGFLKFMNPLRFFELEALFNNTPKEGTIKLNSYSYLADFGGRVFVAYGYYQTIQAFRRFGRK